MSTTGETTTHTISHDGTRIAYVTSGQGPPLLLVHGGLGDHTRWNVLRPHLEASFTVHAMDRRGRGGSGDTLPYAIEREYEDVAAVVDAVAQASGSSVDVYGHSYGGLCAIGAAELTSDIGRLVLYEGWAPVDPDAFAPPPGLLDRLEELLEEGDREGLVETFLREFVKMTDDEIDRYRAQPSWPARVAAAHTILREERAFQDLTFDPIEAAKVTVPTLLLAGEHQTLDWQADTVLAALPDARLVVLEGQAHTADVLAPELVAETLLHFLQDRR